MEVVYLIFCFWTPVAILFCSFSRECKHFRVIMVKKKSRLTQKKGKNVRRQSTQRTPIGSENSNGREHPSQASTSTTQGSDTDSSELVEPPRKVQKISAEEPVTPEHTEVIGKLLQPAAVEQTRKRVPVAGPSKAPSQDAYAIQRQTQETPIAKTPENDSRVEFNFVEPLPKKSKVGTNTPSRGHVEATPGPFSAVHTIRIPVVGPFHVPLDDVCIMLENVPGTAMTINAAPSTARSGREPEVIVAEPAAAIRPNRRQTEIEEDLDAIAVVPATLTPPGHVERENEIIIVPDEDEIVFDGDEDIVDRMARLLDGQEGLEERMQNARAYDEEQIQLLREEIDRERQRYRQIPSYLRAMNRRADEYELGPFDRVCAHCAALYFASETNTRNQYQRCCQNGKVGDLPLLEEYPEFLKHHFRTNRNFRKASLQYNYAFQFASTTSTLRELGPGPQVYAIQGQMKFNISNVNVNEPRPNRGPLYFLEPEAAVFQRMANSNREVLEERIVRQLEDFFRENNPYAQAYYHLKEVYEEELRENPQNVPVLCMEILQVKNLREYDLPQNREVAAICRYDRDMPRTLNLRLFLKEERDRFQELTFLNDKVDPLTFPVLFPRGERGWHYDMRHVNLRANANPRQRTHLTISEYYGYRLAQRRLEENEFNRFYHTGKLLQQYTVSAYVRIEASRMSWFYYNQAALRAERYVGLMDYLHRYGQNNEAEAVGRMVILPSTFIGSPRAQHQNFQDALCVCAKFGNPSLFITMTCNPKWPEIIENIPANDDASNHPLLICRVFHAKLKNLEDEMWKGHIFGVPEALLYVIEFQKRGLPHAHMLLWLRAEDKTTDPIRVDQLISAELPDPDRELALYNAIRRHMMHGPCGPDNPHSPCMKEGKCSKGFPKAYAEHTILLETGQIVYKRPDNGRQVMHANRPLLLDNRYVVPYNAYVLLRYNCHINVEACASIKVVKYLFKYFFKGVDKALIRITNENQVEYNEIEAYLTGRYLSPPESGWHILQLPMHFNTHTVIRLPVHLQFQQTVYFREGDIQRAVDRNESTHLTDWFRLNREDPLARQYLYTEIPLHYVWDSSNKRWKERRRGQEKIITRMYSVSVRNTETYYLRLLLLHVRGPQSYEDVKTVDGRVCDTFLEACRLRNLLQDDAEWRRCMREAVRNNMPSEIRQLFACILCFCTVGDPPALWEEFREALMEDFTRRGVAEDEAIQRTLSALQSLLMVNGKRLSDFNLPEPDVPVVLEEDRFDPEEERERAEEIRDTLTQEQRDILEAVLDAVNDDAIMPRLFYLQGAAGCGKTYLYNAIITALRGARTGCMVVAYTGLAASILKGGRTVHSTFKFAIPMTETTVSGVTPNSRQGLRIKESKILIWDEISMVSKMCFEAVDRTLKDLMRNDLPFGGKVVLAGGDFKQTLPILLQAYRTQIVDECVNRSPLWVGFVKKQLTVNMRAGEDEREFSQFLLQMGEGTLRPAHPVPGHPQIIDIPRGCLVNDVEHLIDACFPDIGDGAVPKECILTPLNADCNDLNDRILSRLPGQVRTYLSSDVAEFETEEEGQAINYPVEYLNSLEVSGIPSHKLTLKVGAVVILLRNLNLKEGLCNGTRLIVRHLGNQYIKAQRIGSDGNLTDHQVLIPRIDFIPINTTLAFTLRRRQFPVKLAYVMTINKSQGQTFEKVGIYLPNPVFAHGQLYVAFSRTKSFDRVFVRVEEGPAQGKLLPNVNEVYTKNIVYREVLY